MDEDSIGAGTVLCSYVTRWQSWQRDVKWGMDPQECRD